MHDITSDFLFTSPHTTDSLLAFSLSAIYDFLTFIIFPIMISYEGLVLTGRFCNNDSILPSVAVSSRILHCIEIRHFWKPDTSGNEDRSQHNEKMLDRGKEQTIVVEKGATESLMFMQTLKKISSFLIPFFFFNSSCSHSGRFSLNCIHNIQFIPFDWWIFAVAESERISEPVVPDSLILLHKCIPFWFLFLFLSSVFLRFT